MTEIGEHGARRHPRIGNVGGWSRPGIGEIQKAVDDRVIRIERLQGFLGPPVGWLRERRERIDASGTANESRAPGQAGGKALAQSMLSGDAAFMHPVFDHCFGEDRHPPYFGEAQPKVVILRMSADFAVAANLAHGLRAHHDRRMDQRISSLQDRHQPVGFGRRPEVSDEATILVDFAGPTAQQNKPGIVIEDGRLTFEPSGQGNVVRV